MSSPIVFSVLCNALCASRIATATLVLVVSGFARAEEAAPADPILVAFQYSAPPSCPVEERAFKLLQSRSERVVRAEDESGAQRLLVDIAAAPAGYHGTLTVIRPDAAVERRSMKGTNCAEVVEALALTAALSIDPNATLTLSSPGQDEGTSPTMSPEGGGDNDVDGVADAQESTSAPSSATSAALPPDTPKRRFRHSSSGSSTPLRTTLGLVLGFARVMDNTSHWGGGISLSFSEPGGRVLFPLDAHITLQALFDPAPGEAPRITTRLLVAQLSYCPIRIGLNLSFAACGRLDLGALTAQSEGFEESGLETESQVTRFYASAGMEGRLSLLLADHWTLWAAPGLSFPLTERQFAVEPGPEVLVSTADVAWNVTLGFGWTF